jgi:hypothetical protein
MLGTLPKVLLLPPLMLALLVFGAPIEDGETWRVDQLTRQGPQKSLLVEREGDEVTATAATDDGSVFAIIAVVDAEKGRFSIKPGGGGSARKVAFDRLIEDFDRESIQSASELELELQNGEKARFYRSGEVVYLSAPGQGVTFAARKVE